MSELTPRDDQALRASSNLMRGLVQNHERLVGRSVGLRSEVYGTWRYFDYKAIEWLGELPFIRLLDMETSAEYTILGSALTDDVCDEIERLNHQSLDVSLEVPGFYFGSALTGSHVLLAPLISEVSAVAKDIQARHHLLCIPGLGGLDIDGRYL